MIIIGVDPGYAHCGIAAVQKRGDEYSVLATVSAGLGPKRDEGDRITAIADAMLKMVKRFPVAAVGFERNFFGRNKSSAFKVAQVVGVLKYICHKYDKKFYEFLPQDVKSSVGAEDKEKETIAVAVKEIVGQRFSTTHETDAVAVALTYFKNIKQ